MRLCTTLLALLVTSQALAQDFRVYTAVSDLRDPRPGRNVVARSLTLFHGGRAYDHMEEFGELVIFDPQHDRFVLLRDNTACEVSFDELRRLLDVATEEAQRVIARNSDDNDPATLKLQAQLRFQLQPEFSEQADATAGRVVLEGSEFSYEVGARTEVSPVVLDQYLTYTDWAARLNTVLHHQAMFPAPRERLNEALRAQALLPVSVTLRGRDADELALRADHEFRFELQDFDRDLIHQWERMRESPQMQWVTFREYQQRLLVASQRAR
jgi:hypothetical protein